MKYSIDEAFTEIQKRRNQLIKCKMKKEIKWLGLCVSVLAAFLMGNLWYFSGQRKLDAEYCSYASIYLAQGTGGYVLVGVIAFMAGVVLTVFLLYRNKRRKEDKEKESL